MFFYLFIYLLGGVTFLPLLAAALYFYADIGEPSAPPEIAGLDPETARLKEHPDVAEKAQESRTAYPVEAAAWVYLSQHYINVTESGDVETVAPPSVTNETAKSSLKKVVTSSNAQASKEAQPPVPKSLNKLPKYWAVIRGGFLLLYTDDTTTKLVLDLPLNDFVITLWPPGAEDFELFYKKYAICVVSRTGTEGLVSLDIHPRDPPKRAYFLYMDSSYEKEDLYFALIKEGRSTNPDESLGPRDPTAMAQPIIATEQEKRELLSHVYSIHESPKTQWLNALLGRLFLAVKDSRQVKEYYREKIVFKLTRTKPSFIGDIQVKDLFCGTSIPYLVDVELKDLDSEGNLTLAASLTYRGGFFVNLATTAQISIPGFKTRTIDLVLAVTLRSLVGRIVVKVKRPPSSRIWYSFESMPKMDLLIEPAVSQRQFNYSFITKGIAAAIREAFKESMVMPYMDDMSFFDTSDEFYRGGIWDPRNRPSQTPWHPYDKTANKSPETAPDVLSSAKTTAPDGSPLSTFGEPISRTSTISHLTLDTPPVAAQGQSQAVAPKSPGRSETLDSISSAATASSVATAATGNSGRWRSWSQMLRKRTAGTSESGGELVKEDAENLDISQPKISPLLSPQLPQQRHSPGGPVSPIAAVTPATVSVTSAAPSRHSVPRRPVAPQSSDSTSASTSASTSTSTSKAPAAQVPLIGLRASPSIASLSSSVAIAIPGNADGDLRDVGTAPMSSVSEASMESDTQAEATKLRRKLTVARKPVSSTATELLSDTLAEDNASIDAVSLREGRPRSRTASMSSVHSRSSRTSSKPPPLQPKRRRKVLLENVAPEPESRETETEA